MTACPVGYLEDLSKYFTENQYTINEDGNIEFTDFLLSESLTKLHQVPCFVYFHPCRGRCSQPFLSPPPRKRTMSVKMEE